MCGEAAGVLAVADPDPGPSPRVRGSLGGDCHAPGVRGSIPACAGKPAACCSGVVEVGVHPRVCGEASEILIAARPYMGPSPRVRGSPQRDDRPLGLWGSIPACAGKPIYRIGGATSGGVHPRVCGEAALARAVPALGPGPSPRVRGSPVAVIPVPAWNGSIPACAGKPRHRPRPRAERLRALGRSIPACAGKPRRVHVRDRPDGVHPRVCGEASGAGTSSATPRGPSPRVRGSPECIRWDLASDGSIPACAGKPAEDLERAGVVGVHPRVCGEAALFASSMVADLGPSPRVRGSRASAPTSLPPTGSIPACAGKPRRTGACWPRTGVHPRVCGEATATTWPAAPV